LVEAREGLTVVGVHELAPALVVGEGPLGRHAAPADAQAEARRGLALLAALSPFDSGQAVVMMDGRAVAIEGVEGTDAMLERVAALRHSGRLRVKGRRGLLVKAPKRGQDLRMDMPVIGPGTLRRVAEAGLAGVAVEAGGVLLAGREDTRKRADAGRLFVQGIPATPAPGALPSGAAHNG
jgi:UDP-2,3-diacylglucosamine hydrolase